MKKYEILIFSGMIFDFSIKNAKYDPRNDQILRSYAIGMTKNSKIF